MSEFIVQPLLHRLLNSNWNVWDRQALLNCHLTSPSLTLAVSQIQHVYQTLGRCIWINVSFWIFFSNRLLCSEWIEWVLILIRRRRRTRKHLHKISFTFGRRSGTWNAHPSPRDAEISLSASKAASFHHLWHRTTFHCEYYLLRHSDGTAFASADQSTWAEQAKYIHKVKSNRDFFFYFHSTSWTTIIEIISVSQK